MYALRMLGLVVLAGMCVVGFVVFYDHFRGLSASQRARREASRLHEKIEYVIITGENRDVRVEVPEGYTLSFESNQLLVDGIRFPESGYDMDVEGPKLDPGIHDISIGIEGGVIKVREAD